MEKLFILAYFLMIMLDKVVISDARRLLLDFLIGERNRKNAKKIHAEQSFSDRVKMGYILPMLKKYTGTFRKYHILYLVILYSLIPQYITIVLFHIFVPSVIWYVFGVFLAIKLLITIFYTLELGPQKMSVYAQKKK
mgnify:CR=1 FL=1